MSTLEKDVERVRRLVMDRMKTGGRTIIAIAGPPASGKSTLAELAVQALNAESNSQVVRSALLPMDGYHLDNSVLEARGLLSRKGAPETFDAYGFCEAVPQLLSMTRDRFYPRFDRKMDLSIANAITIHAETPVIVIEGNYLLMRSEPWSRLKSAFSATVFVSPPWAALRERLVQRWIDHGLEPDAALSRAESNDLPNAALVLRHSAMADLWLNQDGTELGARYAY